MNTQHAHAHAHAHAHTLHTPPASLKKDISMVMTGQA
jgi:hypothetical protein